MVSIRKMLFAFLPALLWSSAALAFCQKNWDGSAEIAKFVNGVDSQNIQLFTKESSQPAAEIKLGHARAYFEAITKMSSMAGLDPKFVICADRVPNAFATLTPSGPVVGVTAGMLAITGDNRNIAAAIIGHELAHHSKRHLDEGRQTQAVINLIGAVVGVVLEVKAQRGGSAPGDAWRLAQFGTTLVSRKFSRDQEREADQAGFDYMVRAGYDPRGSIALSQRMLALSKRGGSTGFFDTHPGWTERKESFEQMIAASALAQELIARVSAPPAVAIAPNPESKYREAMVAVAAKDFPKGSSLAEEAVSLGHGPAKVLLATMHLSSQAPLVDFNKATKLLEEASSQGLNDATFELASLYGSGKHFVKDTSKAQELFGRAANSGHVPSMVALAVMLQSDEAETKNPAEAVRLLRQAAEKDHPAAIALLARAYLTGSGVDRDEAEGLRLARLSSVLGSPAGNTLMGLIRMRGDFGVERSEEEAFSHFLRGADGGDQLAMYHLGLAHEKGRGTRPDPLEARTWFEKSASSGNPLAMAALARLK